MPSVMEPAERDFWIAVTLWGAALVTVFGCGLYAFIEQSFAYGAVFMKWTRPARPPVPGC